MTNGTVHLPPGFKFLPTDEELVLHFLYRKASRLPCHPSISIPHLDPHSHDPWQLNGKALCGENKWYFFSQMDDQDGNRVTENGYWKKLDFEEYVISNASSGVNVVGMKKYFCFYVGEAPLGGETNWKMQEYHLCNPGTVNAKKCHKRKGNRKFASTSAGFCNWVLCRVCEEEDNSQSLCYGDDEAVSESDQLSCLDEMFLSLDDDLADVSNLPN